MPASVIALLQAIGHDRTDLPLASLGEAHARWIVEAGLGAWLRRCTAEDPDAEKSPLWPLVRGAELTARVIAAEQVDAVEEIIDDCLDHIPPLTLLKGISVCEQYYPEPHLRTMGDVDLLVDDADAPVVEARLRRLGYHAESSNPPAFYDTHHHLCPMFHPRRRVWVEIHRRLFPPAVAVGADPLFNRDNVAAQSVPATFRGRRVNHLSAELQLVYLASHWASDLQITRGMVGIVDVMQILKSSPRRRWDRVLPGVAAGHVHLLLTYLARHRLAGVDEALLRMVAGRQRSFGALTLAAAHALLDRYVVDGLSPGVLVSARNFEIAWKALLGPGPPLRNVLTLTWGLLPSRGWLAGALRKGDASPRQGPG